MPKRYRLRLTEANTDLDHPQGTHISLDADAFELVGWLLSAAETITHDDPRAREQLYRLSVTQAERLGRQRHAS